MPRTPIRVMQVVSNLEVGGAQEVVRTVAENLEKRGCVSVVCAFQDGPLRQPIEDLGIPVEILPARRHSFLKLPHSLIELWRIRSRLLDLVRRYEIDVLQTHLLRSLDFLVLSLRLQESVLVFWTFQNALFDLRPDHLARNKWLLRPKRASHRLLYRLGANWVDGFIAVSEDVKTAILDYLGTRDGSKVAVIFNSVDVSRYRRDPRERARVRGELGFDEADRLMAVVATFKRQKGHTYLIDAAAQVAPDHPELHILFIGDGELRRQLEEQTAKRDLHDNIHFLGTRRDVPALLSACDYFVLPSLWEGLSMALVEAMASELPIIATEVSGTTQVMVPDQTGYMVPPGDVESLASSMRLALLEPERASKMGQRARQRVETMFGAEKQAYDHVALFERMLSATRSNHPAVIKETTS